VVVPALSLLKPFTEIRSGEHVSTSHRRLRKTNV
jgi:hypothetical protein